MIKEIEIDNSDNTGKVIITKPYNSEGMVRITTAYEREEYNTIVIDPADITKAYNALKGEEE